MSTTNKIGYQNAGSSTAITMTLTSLASGGARQSTAVDNTVNLFLDALVTFKITVGTVTGTPQVQFYIAGSIDGTNWPGEGSANNDGVTGTDGTITLEVPTNLIPLGPALNTPTSAKTYFTEPMSVAAAFNGVLPNKWSLVAVNNTGAALSASNCSAQYQGISSTNG